MQPRGHSTIGYMSPMDFEIKAGLGLCKPSAGQTDWSVSSFYREARLLYLECDANGSMVVAIRWVPETMYP